MQDFLGSVRRSLVFNGEDCKGSIGSGIAEKIGSCLRKSRVGLLAKARFLPPPPLPPVSKEDDVVSQIRWRKGELIGAGAYGRVYMGMNLDSGELLAVKQVSIASKEKAQALEEEVKLLKNLDHRNIVRYLGTAREEETLNILLEFVPGGSISSLLGKFGSFPEEVIRTYTKQLLEGLEYLHRNGIIHRDIKGANILVDNNGHIKLADFGASKQVVELATISGAKSMKGTPYWMAPEVIVGSGHTFSADIWSVGCTFIEMATGKPPWSQQYEEFAALFHIGTTKSHPPIPEHLSAEAKDFLLRCLQKEPNLRPAASDLLQHPFVTGECQKIHPIHRASIMNQELTSSSSIPANVAHQRKCVTPNRTSTVQNYSSASCSTVYPDKVGGMEGLWGMNTSDDMCQLDGFEEDLAILKSGRIIDPFTESFNPMSEPIDDWPCKFDESRQQDSGGVDNVALGPSLSSEKEEMDFTFSCGQLGEEDEEVMEKKIRDFLHEKALEVEKLKVKFCNTLNISASTPATDATTFDEEVTSSSKLPPKSRPSPSRVASGASPNLVDYVNTGSPVGLSRRFSSSGAADNHILKEIPPPRLNEWIQQEVISPSMSSSERQRKWKEELDQELAREREMKRMTAAGMGGKTSSPIDKGLNRKRERLRFPLSPGK